MEEITPKKGAEILYKLLAEGLPSLSSIDYSEAFSLPGWSKGKTWQELLDARTIDQLNVKNL